MNQYKYKTRPMTRKESLLYIAEYKELIPYKVGHCKIYQRETKKRIEYIEILCISTCYKLHLYAITLEEKITKISFEKKGWDKI